MGRLQEDTRVFLVFSYFFASRSLSSKDIQSLVRFVCALRDSPKVTALVMVYVNASFPSSKYKDNYVEFKLRMGLFESKAARLGSGTEYEILWLKGRADDPAIRPF